jgi:large subunit ribosomal protein L18
MKVNHRISKIDRRKIRVRMSIHGSATRPRVSIFRSNSHIYVQVINDDVAKTLMAVSDRSKSMSAKLKGKKRLEKAVAVAEQLAQQLKSEKITAVVYDRGQYRYHGIVKQVADTLRNSGIQV